MNNDVVPLKGKYYVYTLARPNGKVFYVGKGSGARAEEHERDARRGSCICRKCRIIRGILDQGKHVQIAYVFETDDNAEALRYERDLTIELSRAINLCNYAHNRFDPSLPKPLYLLARSEYDTYLSELDLPKKAYIQRIKEWEIERLRGLEHDWRVARSHNQDERAEELRKAIEEHRATIGRVYQHSLGV